MFLPPTLDPVLEAEMQSRQPDLGLRGTVQVCKSIATPANTEAAAPQEPSWKG